MGETAGQITSRKRILFFVPAFKGGSGGPERAIAVLLRSLDHDRYECHLALAQTGHAYLEEIPHCVAVHQLQVSRMRYALPGILRLVWRLRPQTILATVSYLNAMVIIGQSFFPRGIKLLLREATTPSAFIEKDTHYPRLWSWLYRRLYPRAERIICLSDSVLEDMALHFGIPREKLVRIYNPVEIKTLRQLASAQGNPYRESGPHLVTAGRLRHEKGVDLLLEAMSGVIKRFPGVRLAILGEGPLEAELKAQASALKVAHAIDFLGFQPNPWSYIKHADLFVLASRFEGLPNVD